MNAYKEKIEKLKLVAEGKYPVGTLIGNELTALDESMSEDTKCRHLKNIEDGIGKVIKVSISEGALEFLAVLEDIDFSDSSKKRYIFSYFDNQLNNITTVDTLYHKGWKIIEGEN